MRLARENKVKVARRPDSTFISDSTVIGDQRVVIVFHNATWDATNTWWVTVLVGATRKEKKAMRTRGDFPMRISGYHGLKPLVWASKKMDEFQAKMPGSTLIVTGADDRRSSAYRALTRKGFIQGFYDEQQVLFRVA